MINKLKKEIDKYNVISFDIFDTLVRRKVEEPESIFELIGKIEEIDNFRKVREHIQTKAFKTMHQNRLGEITLVGIYNELDNENSEKILELEEELELEFIYLNDEILEVYNYALDNNKKIILISDMYLSLNFFKRLFEKLDLHGYEGIFVSSELNSTKRDSGELFIKVCNELNIKTESILHIGDNYMSDYQRAKENGLNAFHYNIKKETCNNLVESIVIGLQKFCNQKFSHSIYNEFGINIGILSFFPFFKYLEKEVVDNKIDLVLFVARDGYLLNELWSKYSKTNVNSQYLYGSRVLYVLASINEKNFNENLDFLISGYYMLSVHEVFDRIGINTPGEAILIQGGFTDKDYILKNNEDLNKLIKIMHIVKNDILKKSFEIRHNLFNYFNCIGISNNSNIMFVDVGWSGTTQFYFNQLIEKMFSDVNIFGTYYGLIEDKKLSDRKKIMKMKSYLKEKKLLKLVDENRVVVELCFSAPHKSIIGINKINNEFNLIYDNEKGSSTNFERIINEINSGISIIFEELIKFERQYQIELDYEQMNEILFDFLLEPDIKYVEEIGKINNFDTWSSTKNYSFYFALSEDIKKKSLYDKYDMWLNGYKIINGKG